MTDSPAAHWCRSRRAGAVCTRPAGHPGLHNRVGTALLWSDLQADPPACPGAGMPAAEAPRLADGFPDGRALCAACWDFVARTPDGALVAHDSFRGARSSSEAAQRAAWFNAFGWRS